MCSEHLSFCVSLKIILVPCDIMEKTSQFPQTEGAEGIEM